MKGKTRAEVEAEFVGSPLPEETIKRIIPHKVIPNTLRPSYTAHIHTCEYLKILDCHLRFRLGVVFV